MNFMVSRSGKSLLVFIYTFLFFSISPLLAQPEINSRKNIKLPKPRLKSHYSIEEALQSRRSIRSYKKEELTIEELSQLLWAAQGITKSGGYRTAPSAGALYPVEIVVAVGSVEGLSPGVYRYLPKGHKIKRIASGDKRRELSGAALGQDAIEKAPVSLIIAVVYHRTVQKYGDRGYRYADIETGNVSQNIYLQCEALQLGTVVIGAFQEKLFHDILELKNVEKPLLIMPVGRKK